MGRERSFKVIADTLLQRKTHDRYSKSPINNSRSVTNCFWHDQSFSIKPVPRARPMSTQDFARPVKGKLSHVASCTHKGTDKMTRLVCGVGRVLHRHNTSNVCLTSQFCQGTSLNCRPVLVLSADHENNTTLTPALARQRKWQDLCLWAVFRQ